MWKFTGPMLLSVLVAAPAAAEEPSARVSIGYAFAHYLEEGGGSAPLGAYISIASTGPIGVEGDVAYHRDSEESFGESFVLNTLIAAAGARFVLGDDPISFVHFLFGIRHDRFEGGSNTATGGVLGAGLDIPAGEDVFIHLGVDFQIFLDEGEDLKTLRLAGGITF